MSSDPRPLRLTRPTLLPAPLGLTRPTLSPALPRGTPAWIREEFVRFPELAGYSELVRALDTASGAPRKTWATIHKQELRRAASKADNIKAHPSQLRPLAEFLKRSYSGFGTEARLTTKQRRESARSIQNHAAGLALELKQFEITSQSLDWLFACNDLRYRLIRRMAAYQDPKNPLGEQVLNGWMRGVLAVFDHPADFLETIREAAVAWNESPPSPRRIARPNEKNAARTFFLRVLSRHFEGRYGRPLYEETRAFAQVFFPGADQLEIPVIFRLCKPESRRPKGAS